MFLEFRRPDSYVFARRVGFYDKSPIAQFADGIGRQDVTANTGSAMNVGAKFNGNTGSNYYSVGDVVYAFKQYGLLDT